VRGKRRRRFPGQSIDDEEYDPLVSTLPRGRGDGQDASGGIDPYGPGGIYGLPASAHVRNTSITNAQQAQARKDLSNMKLAMNQTELSRQISELREIVEVQGKVIGRLVEVLERFGVKDVGGGGDAQVGAKED